VNYETIPSVIYTWPEIAWVGKTSRQLRDGNMDFRSGIFPFAGNGRAHAMGDGMGLVKILSDGKTDRVLGAHIIGPFASELISEMVTVMEFGGAAEDVARIVHAHPTLSEAVHEAALAVGGRALHR
jgi:dihydrolipoamide dehydrogenase